MLEWNGHGDFQRFGNVCRGIDRQTQYYKILGVDYFPAAAKDTLVRCMNGPYEVIILDYGRIEDGNVAELIRCSKNLRCCLSASGRWKLHSIFLGSRGGPGKGGIISHLSEVTNPEGKPDGGYMFQYCGFPTF